MYIINFIVLLGCLHTKRIMKQCDKLFVHHFTSAGLRSVPRTSRMHRPYDKRTEPIGLIGLEFASHNEINQKY